jgi:hypothetical protein
MKKIISAIWHDPVWSNLIANSVTAFTAWLFYKYARAGSGSATNSLRAPVTGNQTYNELYFQAAVVEGLLYIFLGCIAVLIFCFLFKLIRGTHSG